MPPTSAIFLDVANTLLHKPALYPAIGKVLADAGIDVPEALLANRHRLLSEAIAFPDRTSRAFYEQFNAQLLRALGVAAQPELLDALYAACSYLPWAPFPDVACLESLAPPLGALSNWDRSLPEKLEPLTGLTFHWILGSEEQQVRKPDPAFFQKVLDTTGLPAREVVYVGDSVMLDVEPARTMGMRAYLIDRDDLYPHGNLPRLRSFAELGAVL
jgi:HAD superfamily hydrolase (TIGR01493 family)